MPTYILDVTPAQRDFIKKLNETPSDHEDGVYVWQVGSVVTAKRLRDLSVVILTDPIIDRTPLKWSRVRFKTYNDARD